MSDELNFRLTACRRAVRATRKLKPSRRIHELLNILQRVSWVSEKLDTKPNRVAVSDRLFIMNKLYITKRAIDESTITPEFAKYTVNEIAQNFLDILDAVIVKDTGEDMKFYNWSKIAVFVIGVIAAVYISKHFHF